MSAMWGALVAAISRGTVVQSQLGDRTLIDLHMLNGEMKARVELIMPFGMSAKPAKGDAITLTVGGTRDHVIAIAVDDEGNRIIDLNDGEFGLGSPTHQIIFRNGTLEVRGTGPLVVDMDGDVAVTSHGTITAKAALMIIDGNLHVTGAVIAGFGGGDQVGLQSHTHTQGNDTHGDGESPTNAPTANT